MAPTASSPDSRVGKQSARRDKPSRSYKGGPFADRKSPDPSGLGRYWVDAGSGAAESLIAFLFVSGRVVKAQVE